MNDGDGTAPVTQDSIKQAALWGVSMQHRLTEATTANRIQMIQQARAFGASWDELGAAMGMSRQAAHRHFGQYVT